MPPDPPRGMTSNSRLLFKKVIYTPVLGTFHKSEQFINCAACTFHKFIALALDLTLALTLAP